MEKFAQERTVQHPFAGAVVNIEDDHGESPLVVIISRMAMKLSLS
jgi:hypothetical protein